MKKHFEKMEQLKKQDAEINGRMFKINSKKEEAHNSKIIDIIHSHILEL